MSCFTSVSARRCACACIMLLGAAGAITLTGCQATNNGGMFSYTGGPTTIQSTETMQKSVRMIDVRSGEVFFSLDIPAGKQLTFDFERGDGDDPVYTPDLMRYEVKDANSTWGGFGRLHSAMTVPNAASRRVDVLVRQGVQYAPGSPEQSALRTDQLQDRPDWWTPRGGALPDDDGHSVYDH